MLAPEHPLVQQWSKEPGQANFDETLKRFQAQDRTARMTGEIEKEGFDTGRTAINPFTNRPVPIWVANFVLGEYGTGAVMGVPGHDQRDFEFATKYDLPIIVVIQPDGGAEVQKVQTVHEVQGARGGNGAALDPASMTVVYDGPGRLVNSGEFDGLPSEEAIEKMTAVAQARGIGEGAIQYRLKDWGISRQRYWGTPIPVLYCEKCGMVPVPADDLPVLLAKTVEFSGRGDSPLAQIPEFVNAICPECGGPARRRRTRWTRSSTPLGNSSRFCNPKNPDPVQPNAR